MADAEPFEFDVFISYSSQDKEWVRGELLKRIEEAGVKVFIDFRDVTRGAPSINEMTRAVQVCRKTLTILSPDYVQSEWCEIEHLVAAVLGPANRALRLIPLLKADCETPPHLGALTHINFTAGADHELAWRQLLTALGKPPVLEPPRKPQRDEWFLAHPYLMPSNFTGRVDKRTMLNRRLSEGTGRPLMSFSTLGGFPFAWHWLMCQVAPT